MNSKNLKQVAHLYQDTQHNTRKPTKKLKLNKLCKEIFEVII